MDSLEKIFQLNDDVDIIVENDHVGKYFNRILKFKNFFKHPEKILEYVKNSNFENNIMGSEYRNVPGEVLNISRLDKVKEYITDSIVSAMNQSTLMSSLSTPSFSIQRYNVKEKVRRISLMPHIDNCFYSGILSLNTNEVNDKMKNGTAFYRHIPSNTEYTTHLNYRYSKIQKDTESDFIVNEMISPHDLVDFNPDVSNMYSWKRYHVEKFEWNKLIIFEGSMYHSIFFDKDTTCQENRLTFNFFK